MNSWSSLTVLMKSPDRSPASPQRSLRKPVYDSENEKPASEFGPSNADEFGF